MTKPITDAQITETQRIVAALPAEMPEDVRGPIAELVAELASELEKARPPAVVDAAARSKTIEHAVTGALAQVEIVLPPGELRSKVTERLTSIKELAIAGGTPAAKAAP